MASVACDTLPRLSSALRAFSNVSAEVSAYDKRNRELFNKRLRRAKEQNEEESWSKLVTVIKKNAIVDQAELQVSLKELKDRAKDIVGHDSNMETIESAAFFLFQTFQNVQMVGHSESVKLRSIFGPFPATVASSACKIVSRIISWLPEYSADLFAYSNSCEKNSEKQNEEFGNNVKFSVEPLISVEMNYSSSESEDEVDSSLLSLKYQCNKDQTALRTPDGKADSKQDNFNTSALISEVKKHFNNESYVLGMTIENLCSNLFDFLSSSKSDDALQNDLFEFLGFDQFELIENLLKNRNKYLDDAILVNKGHKALPAARKRNADGPSRPTYGCQVTVQTEEEKQLMKMIRREEKKSARKECIGNEINSTGFDPSEMRAQREAALLYAQSSQVLTKRSATVGQTKESLPFVFDSLAEARKSSAFVGSCKMSLPIGFERIDKKMFEEVHIPASEKAPLHIGKKLVSIDDLDEVGSMAFKGMKTLNRIQSIVYETAYKTNENLLICAPTGAGKTNIAMLTVIRVLKQNIVQNVIRKDQFKIVYVAPMKALAAEMVRNFGKRLEPLGITVRELTGDMQLTKQEIVNTQMLVTTPEKWDVVTRKGTGDVSLSQLVKLLIIDEVHLLHDDRGAVIESLVARTLRQVEATQSMIRIVGLSATLPNYLDVGRFLRVNPALGLFFFDGRFRPVPLEQSFIGIKSINKMQQLQDFNTVCYEKVLDQVKKGYQVMVFVHARNETLRTAKVLRELALNSDNIHLFAPQGRRSGLPGHNPQNRHLQELFPDGFGIHHAGMLRQDRNLVEKYFSEGSIKVLVCTATLAWGVNLPAHAVIIKGTQIYDAKKGSFIDIGILDVLQIFGRAGRPQFDTFGHGSIITTHDKLAHYLSLMTRQNPIESQFITSLTDNLNAEIALGTVSNVEEAVKWLSYTYLFVRMRCNPMVYGIPYNKLEEDPNLYLYRKKLVYDAARNLDKTQMIRFSEVTENFSSTDLGRIASHFYIKYATVETVNEFFLPQMSENQVLNIVSKAQEFEPIKVRKEELEELERIHIEECVMPVALGMENAPGKVNILIQSYVSRVSLENFSLVSDQAFVAQNAARIVRALFQIALRKGWPIMANRLLNLCKTIDKRQWQFENPLRQFQNNLPYEVLNKIEKANLSLEKMREMTSKEIGLMIHHQKMGVNVKRCVHQIPYLDLDATIQPITRTVLRVRLSIKPEFHWDDKIHGKTGEPFWVWVEDPDNNFIYHSENFLLHKKSVVAMEPQSMVFTIPIFEPLPNQYYIHICSDRWIGSENVLPISFQHLILPERHPPHTKLLDLNPLPKTALKNKDYEDLYKFSHFNPVQTQIFHSLYHTDSNILIGAPTGSGKTVAAEIAIFRVFQVYKKAKAVYIAPLKALVRERITDWKVRIEQKLGKKVVELTGDFTPDMKSIANADLIVTTPEKWDGVSRSWQTRTYVKDVALLVIDEIHLLGDDRGPVLEVIVSRTNFISSHTERNVRIVGLSTALANARDLADWLGIKQVGLFNFRPSVRPVPLEVHVSGFPGQHYCPRMASMNKPVFNAIKTHSSTRPVLIFVSSRRQTRLTALDLIGFLATEDNPKQWLQMPDEEMDNILLGVHDVNLKLTLAFGCGLHHAGLQEKDRKIVEELFVNQKIQVLIATSTLAWGVNFPAHLVIIKGTEYYDGKTRRYVDFPITDVLQMMGRAGRPQFDAQGTAVILVHDIKKHFYKRFLYEPFPVESNLLSVLADHMNAEIVSGTVNSKQDAMDYITWTYFFRRLVMNPSYYELDDTDYSSINRYLSELVEKCVYDLSQSYCIGIDEDNSRIQPTTLGRIASYYYLSHKTLKMFHEELSEVCGIPELIKILSNSHEYAELPVRHNEDQQNSELAQQLPLEVSPHTMDSSHTKTNLLLQAHFSTLTLPSSDYYTDTKSVLDQAIRILQALLDTSADQGWLVTSMCIINLLQMVLQGHWCHESTLLCLPHIMTYHLESFRKPNGNLIECLPELMALCDGKFEVLFSMLKDEMRRAHIEQVYQILTKLPQLEVKMHLKKNASDDGADENQTVEIAITAGGHRNAKQWIKVYADQEYTLQLELSKINKTKKPDTKAYVPKFPKGKDEGWILILGEIESQELIALKRVGYVRYHSRPQLAFFTPEKPGRFIYTFYLMSDSYLGLDQQYDIFLDVLPS
ncbi:activating signal cointegrator 1 complex subunit 3 isoform X1 [Octopus sinensis]|uniref:Activating signal cointegrator 1 complex subunit 3 n=1 Tax=Octopus sinensis TaxID=2607531 RepID=A0A6P7SPN8_9MOLL|nr:activating signal cointegrator 1 complex subunit 3 isoform X1 [Octopus sinensis]